MGQPSSITKTTNDELDKLILANASKIEIGKTPLVDEDPTALLRTIAMLESSYGYNNVPRFEPAYYVGGFLYQRSEELRKLVAKYNKAASCSYSSFQIMYSTACELGYVGIPTNLTDNVAIEYCVKYINNRIIKYGPDDIGDFFDAYNSGNFKDNIIPAKYIQNGMEWYKYFVEHPLQVESEIKTDVPVDDKIDKLKFIINTLKFSISEMEKLINEIQTTKT